MGVSISSLLRWFFLSELSSQSSIADKVRGRQSNSNSFVWRQWMTWLWRLASCCSFVRVCVCKHIKHILLYTRVYVCMFVCIIICLKVYSLGWIHKASLLWLCLASNEVPDTAWMGHLVYIPHHFQKWRGSKQEDGFKIKRAEFSTIGSNSWGWLKPVTWSLPALFPCV